MEPHSDGVQVGIVDTGEHRAAAQVDNACPGTRHGTHLLRRTHGRDPPVDDRNTFGDPVAGVDSDDAAADEDQVSVCHEGVSSCRSVFVPPGAPLCR